MNHFQNFVNRNNRLKNWPMRSLEILLLIVSAWRTWDFISMIMAGLPGVKFYAGLTVLISEGAYIVWSKSAYPNADEGPQESVTIGMIGVNTLGLLLLSFGENLIRATSGFEWASQAADLLAFTPWGMLAINLIGALLFGVLDDDHIDSKTTKSQNRIDRLAERDLKHAEKLGYITAKLKAIEMLESNSDEMARKLAPFYFNDIRSRVAGQTMRNLELEADQLKGSPLFDFPTQQNGDELIPDLISGNGNGSHSPKAS